MKQNKNAVRYAILIAAAIVVVALAAVMGVLRQTGVIATKLNSFMLLFVIMAFGFGAIMTASGVYTKSGYELMVGLTLIDIGLALLLGGLKVHVAVTVIVVVAVLIVAVLATMLLKSKHIEIERTDEQEGFKSYTEVLKEQKEKEQKELEETPMPEIKSFKDDK